MKQLRIIITIVSIFAVSFGALGMTKPSPDWLENGVSINLSKIQQEKPSVHDINHALKDYYWIGEPVSHDYDIQGTIVSKTAEQDDGVVDLYISTDSFGFSDYVICDQIPANYSNLYKRGDQIDEHAVFIKAFEKDGTTELLFSNVSTINNGYHHIPIWNESSKTINY